MQLSQSTLTKPTLAEDAPPLIMSLLRAETQFAHKQLEQTKILARLFAPDFALAEYRDLLVRFYGFVAAIEPLIFDNLPTSHQPVLAHRLKADLLVQDLVALGMDVSAVSHISRCDDLPQLDSFPHQMGALYVMEGSTLGGRVISKRLQERFGATVENKLNYYQAYGDNTGAEWKAFQTFMGKQFDEHGDGMATVIAAANATFTALYHWLDQPAAHQAIPPA